MSIPSETRPNRYMKTCKEKSRPDRLSCSNRREDSIGAAMSWAAIEGRYRLLHPHFTLTSTALDRLMALRWRMICKYSQLGLGPGQTCHLSIQVMSGRLVRSRCHRNRQGVVDHAQSSNISEQVQELHLRKSKRLAISPHLWGWTIVSYASGASSSVSPTLVGVNRP